MSQINIENQELEDERLTLERGTFYFLGPNLTLRRCTLTLKMSARDLVLIGTRFEDCTFEIPRHLEGVRWDNAFLHGCRFKGRLSGCDFGRWPDSTDGGIEDSDFTEAELDTCRFIGCDMSTLKLPRWPCFTLLNPIQRSQELLSLSWPGTTRITVGALLKSPPSIVAVTCSARALAKRRGASEAEIRATLAGLSSVIL